MAGLFGIISGVVAACLFCGSNRMSKEHVWPQWLKGVLPNLAAEPSSAHSGLWFNTVTGESDKSTRSIPNTMLETTVRRPCIGCNGGWMNDIEIAARGALTSLILGEALDLTRERQESPATWAFKTTVMYEFVYPRSSALSMDQRLYLYEHHAPAPGSLVFLAKIDDSGGWEARTRHATTGVAGADEEVLRVQNANTFATTIGLGRVVLHVFGSTRSDLIPFGWIGGPESTEILREEGIFRIWPPRRRSNGAYQISQFSAARQYGS
jgi:hypothetical protein